MRNHAKLYRKALDILLETAPYEEGEKLKEVYEVLVNDASLPDWAVADPDTFWNAQAKFTVPCHQCGESWMVSSFEIQDREEICTTCRVMNSNFSLDSLEKALELDEQHRADCPGYINAIRRRIQELKDMDPELVNAGLRLELLNALQNKGYHEMLNSSHHIQMAVESLRLHGLIDSQEAQALQSLTPVAFADGHASNPKAFWDAIRV